MSESVLSSITHSLEALPHYTWVIDRYGVIQFVSSSWIAYSKEHGLFPRKECVGANCHELFREFITDPIHRLTLLDSLQSIFQGERLVFSTKFTVSTFKKGGRSLELEAFPLMTDLTSANCNLIISLKDLGPVIKERNIQPSRIFRSIHKPPYKLRLIPICASCKSIRNDKEEWLRIEQYLQQKLSLQFTHDICPDCIRQLYPQYAGALKNINEN
ncbi:PAS domain-containing protein [Paenibacillus wynnii]|uniref:Uncharacterized protein n=1 Tax=Paenibacillus wynnii TaxID=268407 RepID=A0A098MAI9_9BACL|nr:PAS domain-containing protein [Paenibacillus wynnii]KGE19063.1 hypothetical protein PWYN_06650 [Paenibacillus wynnii]